MELPVALTAGERRVHENPGRLDRVIPSQAARGFHLDLVEALLEGSGHISGRVHGNPRLLKAGPR